MNERMKLLEAVAGAARNYVTKRGMHPAWPELLAAVEAFDALPAPTPGETVGKVVQIAAICANNGVAACVFALRDDGSIWGKRVDRDGAKWWREGDIPTDVEVTP